MSRRKYTFEQRLEVVMHYLATDEGYRLTSARFNVPRTQVRLWVAAYDVPRFYVSTSKSIIKALINMHSFEIQLSPIG